MLDVLAGSGVRYLFGNPGSTELPLMDAFVEETRIKFILGLQEVPVMSMAEGYAQASRMASVVNLHIACGLGNAMGMLFNAYRSGTPMVITAGQQDRRLMFEEPVLWGDLAPVARPWTKWSAEVQRAADVPSAFRRALQMAMTPPSGPVFLSLPVDVQMEMCEADTSPLAMPDIRVRPSPEAVMAAARVLAEAENPVILAGSRVQEAGATAELVELAERLGAPVIHESVTSHGRCSFPAAHPLAGGILPTWSPEIRERLEQFDVLLVAGSEVVQQYIYHEPPRPVPEGKRIVHVDMNTWEIGKNYAVEAGVVGHLKPALAALAGALDAPAERVKARAAAWGARHALAREAIRETAAGQRELRPMAPLAMMDAIARVLPANAAVVEESPTSTLTYLERSGLLPDASGYFAHRGWALGWGMGCAIGVKLAWPQRPVVAIIGDGSALYGVQALWSAAHYGIPVTFVITNNNEYRILKDCGSIYRLPEALDGNFVGLDLVDPAVDFRGLAKSLGVEALRAESPDELSGAVQASVAGTRPLLIEAPVRRPATR
jgi:benzoylformate decarboxylase